MHLVGDTILSREVGASVSEAGKRWRIGDGAPQHKTYDDAARAVVKQHQNPHLARHLPGLPGPRSWE